VGEIVTPPIGHAARLYKFAGVVSSVPVLITKANLGAGWRRRTAKLVAAQRVYLDTVTVGQTARDIDQRTTCSRTLRNTTGRGAAKRICILTVAARKTTGLGRARRADSFEGPAEQFTAHTIRLSTSVIG
jgi:hypothetical protein